MDPSETALATTVFGSSLDFARIRVSNVLGLGGRPFAVYYPFRGLTVLNLGPGPYGSPASALPLLVHELTHSWQSQHHSRPYEYEVNSVLSQAGSEADRAIGTTSGAYCYRPGRTFDRYAAEQIAQQVENHFLGTGGPHEAAMVAHIRSIPAGRVDPLNLPLIALLFGLSGPSVPRWEPPGGAGVRC